jgi:protein ImuA
MRLISCHDGQLQTLESAGLAASGDKAFATEIASWDAIAPRGSFARGAIHELLFDASDGQPTLVAALLARAASGFSSPSCLSASVPLRLSSPPRLAFPIIWSDPRRLIYPPALVDMGLDLNHVFLLRAGNETDEAHAVTECLRCRGVGAVIASPSALSRIGARRLQLAAERGGTVGILMRPTGRGDGIYAAATRWKISPYPGERTIQRWKIQLLHGHGGQVGKSVILECSRENHSVRAIEKLPDRSIASPAQERAIA